MMRPGSRFSSLFAIGHLHSALAPALLASAGSAAWAQPIFSPLGFLPGDTSSQAYGVSADGTTVTGGTPDAVPNHPWWWRAASGTAPIPGVPSGVGWAVTADGAMIVGSPGFRYSVGLTTEILPEVPLGAWSDPFTARATSADGSTLVGQVFFVGLRNTYAVIWNSSSGYQLPYMPTNGDQSSALGVSADGSVVVGRTYGWGSGAGPAFRWTAAGGLETLGYLGVGTSQSPNSSATAVTADGQVVVGTSTTDVQSFSHPFRWTESGGMVDLWPQLAASAGANAVNADGSVVVGDYRLNIGPLPDAFIWDSLRGSRDLRQVLMVAGAGASLEGWTLNHAYGVSADGLTIVGSGTDPQGRTQAYIAHLPGTGLCYSNCDNSTAAPILNVNDFVCFQQRFAAGDAYANCDGSTMAPVLNAADFICFMSQFASGCR